jgi:hypothetical protein
VPKNFIRLDPAEKRAKQQNEAVSNLRYTLYQQLDFVLMSSADVSVGLSKLEIVFSIMICFFEPYKQKNMEKFKKF